MRLPSTLLIIFSLFMLSACSQTDQGPISIANAWIREAPPGASAMAGYMVISNTSNNALILQVANSPDFGAIEFHRSVEKDGVWKMFRHKQLEINANSSLELKPGDYHLMLFRPQRQLKDGDEVKFNLQFNNDISIDVSVPVVREQH